MISRHGYQHSYPTENSCLCLSAHEPPNIVQVQNEVRVIPPEHCTQAGRHAGTQAGRKTNRHTEGQTG